ncbi:hypothetical protein NXS19_011879 [Fusarium pseudograminearum]|nr:hypothetical protein NXS19_011879 [Fusarium pseudograminearum]
MEERPLWILSSNVGSKRSSRAQSAEPSPKDEAEYIRRARVEASARVEPVIPRIVCWLKCTSVTRHTLCSALLNSNSPHRPCLSMTILSPTSSSSQLL